MKAPQKTIHVRVRPGSSLEKLIASFGGRASDAIHEMAAQLEGAKSKK